MNLPKTSSHGQSSSRVKLKLRTGISVSKLLCVTLNLQILLSQQLAKLNKSKSNGVKEMI